MEYIGIKIVNAEPMHSVNALAESYRTNDYNGDGYEVTYDDGYKFWCPKEVFEKNNFEIKNPTLANTCKLMVSPDYRDRFTAEYYQLENRFVNLLKMINDWDNNNLSFTPTCEKSIYNKQIKAMADYIEILIQRASIENVELTINDAVANYFEFK